MKSCSNDLDQRHGQLKCQYNSGWNACLDHVQKLLRRDLRAAEQGVMKQVAEVVQVQRGVAADEIEQLRKKSLWDN